MNVIVFPSWERGYYFRPDTTIEREGKDFFCPEEVTSLSASIILYVKISRAGKAVSAKFAKRYYNSFGVGLLLYGESLIDRSNPVSYSIASALDYTTILSKEIGELGGAAELRAGAGSGAGADAGAGAGSGAISEIVFDHNSGSECISIELNNEIPSIIEAKIETLSRMNSLRVGDILAIELSQGKIQIDTNDNLKLSFLGQTLLDFKIC